ncbi:MAG: hypothetical protein WC996_04420 [Peptostreptococcales bacterium]|jgi:D-alanyl-D-alanine carboxypeptidase
MKIVRRVLCLLILLFVFTENTVALEDLNLVGTHSIALDYQTDEIIYADNIYDKIQIASITKLMTALLFAENKNKNDELIYTEAAFAQPPYAYRTQIHPVKVGDKVIAEDAMDMLLIYSANDIAYMIGDNVAGDSHSFIEMMDDKAKKLGMMDTKFATLNGLDDEEGKSYSTTYDVALLCKAALENEWVKSSLSKAEAQVSFIQGASAVLETRNKLLGVDGNIAGKTGYTSLAGRCLISLYERDGRQIIGIVMNSLYDFPKDTQVFEDMEKLIDYSYEAEKTLVHEKGKEFEKITVEYSPAAFLGFIKREIDLPLILKENIELYDVDLNIELTTITEDPADIHVWNVKKDTILGKVIVQQGRNKMEFNLVTSLTKKDLILRNIHFYIISFVVAVFLLILILRIINKIRRNSPKYRRYNSRYK